MNILVIGSGGPHKGSASITKSMLSMLKDTFPDAHFTLISSCPEIDSKEFGVKAHTYLISRSPTLLAKLETILSVLRCTIWAALYRFFRIKMRLLVDSERLESLRAYTKADIVVTCAADVLSDAYGFPLVIEALYVLFIGILLKRPTVILASQVGPFKKNFGGRIIASLTKYILNRTALITVRDKLSRKNLQEMGVYKPYIHLTADLAFLLQPAPREKVRRILFKEGIDEEATPLIGINTSALIYRYGFLTSRSNNEKLDKYVKLMSRVTDHIIEKFDATVVLVPHVFGPGQDDDRFIARKIYRRVRHKYKTKLILSEYTPEELKGIIGQFDLFVSTRMHPLIHAISMHVPAVAVDYTFKVMELMRMVGQDRQVCHIRAVNFNELVLKIDATYSARNKIKRDLITRVKVMQKRAMLNGKLLRAFVMRARFEVRGSLNVDGEGEYEDQNN